MKKIILLLLVVVIGCQPTTAYAEELPQYVRITKEDTALYTNAVIGKITMNLQYSYYVKVLTQVGNFYQVELMSNSPLFPKITGYVVIDQVEQCSQTPIDPLYPEVAITVSAGSASIHLSPLSTSYIVYTATNTQSMSYYGSVIVDNTIWHYVYYSGQLGYVKSTVVTTPAISLHPTPVYVQPPIIDDPQQPTEDPPTTPTFSSTAEILLIVFVCLLSVGLVLALFLPHKKTNTNAIWDRHI